MCRIINEILVNDVCQLGTAQNGTGIHQATFSGILV